MTTLDVDATFVKLDKLRARMNRLEKNPDPNEWQYTRLLIRALTQAVVKSRKNSAPNSHRISYDAPLALQEDWEELVDALLKRGIKVEKRTRARAAR